MQELAGVEITVQEEPAGVPENLPDLTEGTIFITRDKIFSYVRNSSWLCQCMRI